jgi:hypothetical protein
MLPNFLVIGAMRSGTTWLDKILRTHHQVYLPKRRKEIHFFDKYFSRGRSWYEQFFPTNDEVSKFKWIGEITPKYIYDEKAPTRIKLYIPDCKFIAILRNPVDRAYSHYGLSVRDKNESRTFVEYMEQQLNVFERGLYGEQIQRYLTHFPVDNFLFLIFEKTINQPDQVIRKIASFLSIDHNGFTIDSAVKRENKSHIPYLRQLNVTLRQLGRYCRNKDLDWIVNIGKSLNLKSLVGSRGELPRLDPQIRALLLEKYESDVGLLETLIKEDLNIWRKAE